MDNKNENNQGFWASVGRAFDNLSLKIKLFIAGVIGFFGIISYFLFKKNINSREILELELKKVKEEIEIEKNQEQIDVNQEKIVDLESRAEEIKREIIKIEKPDVDREISREELDEFFDKRGF